MEERLKLPEWRLLPDIGLYMDQVITLMERTFEGMHLQDGITKSMVNNYVKAGLIGRPVNKRYDREHLAMLLEIAVLKQALSMEEIARIFAMQRSVGVCEGYAWFCRQVQDTQDALISGMVPARPQDERERAALLGVAAAVCTIHARRALRETEENAKKERRTEA